MAITEKLTAIADAIRAKTGKTETMTLADMPQQVTAVYEEGRQAEHDDFWDAYQNHGRRTDYLGAFAGAGWTMETFCPKYDIVPTQTCDRMFSGTGITKLDEALEAAGVTLDLSKASTMNNLFADAGLIESIPVISTVNARTLNYFIFDCQNLKTVEKIILKSDGTQTATSFANNCYALENISFDGVLGVSVSFAKSSLLSESSLQSIIAALADKTGGTAQTLTLHPDAAARLTDEQKAAISAKNWTLVT